MLEPLGAVLKRRFRNFSLEKIGLTEKVFKEWKRLLSEEFDEDFVKEAVPLMLKRGRLIVKVTNPVIACELQARKGKLITLINKGFKKSEVLDISFRV